MTLGQRIQQIRGEHGLSQEAFAERLGTTRQTVSRWELDQTYPEIGKIVLISRIFSVTTDSLLKDGISTFDGEMEQFSCGVYRGSRSELVETEQFALLLYASANGQQMGAKLYRGYQDQKRLVALCERDQEAKTIAYAYLVGEGTDAAVVANSSVLASQLSTPFCAKVKNSMQRLEHFLVDHSGTPLPTVKEAGIPKYLTLWRMADSYRAHGEGLHFYLCTGRTEYIFFIQPRDTNIYCGASYNRVFDLGIFGGGQFFRIRNYKDNTEKWCRFHCDFSYRFNDRPIPTAECELGKCLETSRGLMWCVKRYTDDEIVLQGCGEDEYIYRRTDRSNERFLQFEEG